MKGDTGKTGQFEECAGQEVAFSGCTEALKDSEVRRGSLESSGRRESESWSSKGKKCR